MFAEAFKKFAEKFIEGGRKGICKGDIGLTRNEYCNFQNIQYFGLTTQYEKGNEWYLTALGEMFYYKEFSIKSPIAFMDGKKLPDNHECWHNHKGLRKVIYLNDLLPTHFKRRPEYQEEKSRQGQLF